MGTVTTFTFTSSTETVTMTKLNNLVANLLTEFNGSIEAANIASATITNAEIANTTIDLTAKVTGVLPAANAAATVGTVAASEIVTVDASKDVTGFNDVTIGNSLTITSSNLTITAGNLIMGSTTITETEIGYLDGLTAGTVTASKALVVDSSSDLTAMGDITFAASSGPIFASRAQGDTYYDDGTRTTRLAAGTSGQFLKTQGAAANPVWASAGMGRFISSTTASAASTVNFTSFRDDTLYDNYLLIAVITNLSSSGTDLYMRTSTDGGSTYDSTAGDYEYANTGLIANSTAISFNSQAAAQILLAENIQADGACSGQIMLYNPSLAANFLAQTDFVYMDSGSNSPARNHGVGHRDAAADVDAFQLLPAAGNITGEFELYGFLKA